MAYIIVPSRRVWTRQPQGVSEIDWSNPLARGLDYLIVGGQRYEIARGKPQTAYALTGPGPNGLSSRGFAPYRADADNQDVSIIAQLDIRAVAAGYGAVLWGYFVNASNCSQFGFATNASSSSIIWLNRANAVGGAVIENATYPYRPVLALVGSLAAGSVAKGYKNGRLINAAVARVGTGEFAKNSARSFEALGGGTATQGVTFAAKFSRQLQDGEVLALSENPWQIFRFRRQISYFDMGASSPIYTLTAQKGSYSVTGQSATVLRHKSLTAQTGSYSYTGNTANITYTPNASIFTLTAQTGMYTVAGQAATLYRNRRLSAQVGTYAITGVSADITHVPLANVYNLIAEGGSYTLSGISASISRNRRLSTSSGNYQTTGISATILKSKRLSAHTGIYTYTGQSINISSFDPGANTLVKYINVLTGEILILRPI